MSEDGVLNCANDSFIRLQRCFKINFRNVEIEKRKELGAEGQAKNKLWRSLPVDRAGLPATLPRGPSHHHSFHLLHRSSQFQRHPPQSQTPHRHSHKKHSLHLPPINIQISPQHAWLQPPPEDSYGGWIWIDRPGYPAGLPDIDRAGRARQESILQLPGVHSRGPTEEIQSMQVPGDRGLQQGVSGEKFEGRAVLRHEGDAEEIYQREPEGKYHRELKINHGNAEPPLHRQTQPLLRNPQLRLLRPRLYLSSYLDCPGG